VFELIVVVYVVARFSAAPYNLTKETRW